MIWLTNRYEPYGTNSKASNQVIKTVTLFLLFVLLIADSIIAAERSTNENYIRIILSDSSVKEGSVLTVFVDSGERLTDLNLRYFGKTHPIFRIWHKDYDHLFRSFLAVPVNEKPGIHEITAFGKNEYHESIKISARFKVIKSKFGSQTISLTPNKKRLLDQKNLMKESKSLVKALSEMDKRVYFASPFLRPTRGRITAKFGTHRRYNNGEFRSYHKGIDFANQRGTLVRASNGGRVSLARNMKSNGKIVLINHGHGISTIYAHLDKIMVKKGDWVKRGETIGQMGSSGIATGSHLHFGMSVNNVRVDPWPWLTDQIMIYMYNR